MNFVAVERSGVQNAPQHCTFYAATLPCAITLYLQLVCSLQLVCIQTNYRTRKNVYTAISL